MKKKSLILLIVIITLSCQTGNDTILTSENLYLPDRPTFEKVDIKKVENGFFLDTVNMKNLEINFTRLKAHVEKLELMLKANGVVENGR